MNAGDLLLSEGAAPAQVAERLAQVAPQFAGVVMTDRSDELGLLSVDGPYAWELLKTFLGLGVIGTRYREIVPQQVIGGVDVTLARAGKTGEYGYLLLCEAAHTPTLWDALKQAGEKFDLLPIGFRTADLCRMENRVFSQHQEGRAVDNVFEVNTRAMFGRDKEQFLGRPALETLMQTGLARRIVGVSFDESLAPTAESLAAEAELKMGDRPVGRLVSAGYSYALRRWIGLALIDEDYACVGVNYSVATRAGAIVATLDVAGRWHSRWLEPEAHSIAVDIAGLPFRAASLPVWSTVSGLATQDHEALRWALSTSVAAPVEWHATVMAMCARGIDSFLEVSPGRSLFALLGQLPPHGFTRRYVECVRGPAARTRQPVGKPLDAPLEEQESA